ncbi:MAG: hemerythrin family protein [Nitrospirae bacterium]|nr:hemerythrin family protein [Nitrospirota bacterium]
MKWGIKEIDDQHEALFQKVNQFLNICQRGRQTQEIIGVMSHLEKYISVHFEAEKDLMEKYQYPHRFSHVAHHTKFREDYSDLKNVFRKEETTLRFAMLMSEIVSDWIIKHVNRADRKLGIFLRERGPTS